MSSSHRVVTAADSSKVSEMIARENRLRTVTNTHYYDKDHSAVPKWVTRPAPLSCVNICDASASSPASSAGSPSSTMTSPTGVPLSPVPIDEVLRRMSPLARMQNGLH